MCVLTLEIHFFKLTRNQIKPKITFKTKEIKYSWEKKSNILRLIITLLTLRLWVYFSVYPPYLQSKTTFETSRLLYWTTKLFSKWGLFLILLERISFFRD